MFDCIMLCSYCMKSNFALHAFVLLRSCLYPHSFSVQVIKTNWLSGDDCHCDILLMVYFWPINYFNTCTLFSINQSIQCFILVFALLLLFKFHIYFFISDTTIWLRLSFAKFWNDWLLRQPNRYLTTQFT